MAGYTPRNSGSNSNRPGNVSQTQSVAPTTKSAALFSTGLFATDPAKSKAIGSVQLKEAITIPAGSYINLYEVEDRKEKSPVFKLQFRPGQLKSK